jgi:hypothetical protein
MFRLTQACKTYQLKVIEPKIHAGAKYMDMLMEKQEAPAKNVRLPVMFT